MANKSETTAADTSTDTASTVSSTAVGKVKFKHSTRMRRGWKGGGTNISEPLILKPGDIEEIARPVAVEWQGLGLGKIVGEAG